MTRPRAVVAVLGTATDVGKTWVTARLCEKLIQRGVTVAARKPAQSFEADSDDPVDAEVLAAATGDRLHDVCPELRWYPVPMAPPMAAHVLGLDPPTLAALVAELVWPDEVIDVGFVEAVGGVRSPVAIDGDSRDLASAVGSDALVLVADAGLGTIDAVRSAVDGLIDHEPIVLLNRYDEANDLHRRNRAWLADHDHLDVCTDVTDLVTRLANPRVDP